MLSAAPRTLNNFVDVYLGLRCAPPQALCCYPLRGLHRQWATRSYAIALVFIAWRFVFGVKGWEALGVEIAQAIIMAFAFPIYDSRFTIYRFLWSCLALSVPLANVSIHWKEILALTVPVKSGVASSVAKPNLPKNAVGAT